MAARPMSDKITSSTVLGGVPYTLYSEDGVFMIKAVNICDWLDITYGSDWSKHPDFEAVLEARVAGKDTVIVEDLS